MEVQHTFGFMILKVKNMLNFALWNSSMGGIILSRAYQSLHDLDNTSCSVSNHMHLLSVPGMHQTLFCLDAHVRSGPLACAFPSCMRCLPLDPLPGYLIFQGSS